MTWQSETRAWALAAAGAFALSAIGYRVLTLPKIPDLNSTVSHIDAATGAWANASKQQVQSVAAIERDLRAEMWHLDRTLGTIDGTLRAAQGTLGSVTEAVGVANRQMQAVGPLLDSARTATDAIPAVLRTLPPAIENANGAVTDFRTYMAQDQPDLAATLGNVRDVTGSAAGITADARKVTDKVTADYLKPIPWYMWPVKRMGELWDISAAVARHTP